MADGATPGGYGSLSRGDIKFGTPLHALLQRRLETRMKMAESEQQKHHDRWRKAEEATLAYVPTSEADARRKSRRENSGEPTFTTIQIPYSFAQLMSWHTYQTAVFLSRSPIHQIAGRDGQDEMQTQALEALLAYQVEVGRMVAPYFLWIYESGKYGNSFLGEVWDEDVVSYSTVQEAVDPLTQKLVKAQVTRQIPGYCGSRVYNISPWDFFPDPRVTVLNFQKGEFCGVRSRVMWNDLMAKARKGQYVNVDEIRTARGGVIKGNDVGSEQLVRPVNDWQLDEGDGSNHPAQVEVDEIYVDLEPAEWQLGASTFREKWVFTVTSDHSIVIGAQPLGLMHGQFPVSMLPAEVEGQAAYARGLPEIMEPIQNTMNWLLNVHFYNVRAALNMGFILDPTKIVMKDVSKGGPGFVWRIRPEAFGQNIDTFFRQVQVQDVTQNNMSDLSAMFGIGERVFGISDQMMGAMDAGGGRKTAAEVRTSAGFGTNRSKTGAEFMSATGWGQHGQHLIANSQQFYNAEKKLRIVGDLAQIAGPEFLMVSPENIVGGWDFTPVDGTLPIDRFAQVTMWKDLLGTLATAPAILMQYDLGKIFAWVAQLAGIKNLSRFKVVPDMALQQMAAAGNSVPLGPEDTSAGQPAAGGNMNALLPPQGMGVGAP